MESKGRYEERKVGEYEMKGPLLFTLGHVPVIIFTLPEVSYKLTKKL